MLGVINLLFGCKKEYTENDFQDTKFKVGQIWNYKTRKGEENSKITILKIEKYNEKEIVVHIFVNGLNMKNELRPNGISEDIGHLLMSLESLNKSVTNLVSENNKLPDFKEGYENWKEAFDNNEGGIFSINVSEAVNFAEETIKVEKNPKNKNTKNPDCSGFLLQSTNNNFFSKFFFFCCKFQKIHSLLQI